MTRANQSGFTLIEILIAMAIFAVMAAMAYGGLSSVISAQESVNAALDRSKTLQMAQWRIRSDMEQIVDRPIRDSFGDVQPALTGSPQNGVEFTRDGWTNPLGQPRSNLQRVAYRLDGNNNLVRLHWQVLDQAPDSQPAQRILLPHVTGMEWRYLDDNGRFQDRWPPTTAQSLALSPNAAASGAQGAGGPPPRAIELRLDTRTWGRLRLVFAVAGARPPAVSPPAAGQPNGASGSSPGANTGGGYGSFQ